MSKQRLLDFYLGVPMIGILSLFSRKNSRLSKPPRRILLIKLAAMGDTILLIPVIRSLKEAYPDAEIDWLVSPINAGVAKTVPYVNRVWIWNRRMGWGFLQLLRDIRNRKYDIAVDFEQWARGTALITFLSGAPVRAGFKTPGQFRHRLFNVTSDKLSDRHEIDEFYGLAEKFAPLRIDRRLELWETEQGRMELDRYLPHLMQTKNEQLRILVHPGCGFDGLPREWPLTSYAILGHWLMKNYNAALYLSSGPEETDKTAKLLKLLNGRAVDVGGKFSWMGVISLVNRMDLVISGNTGIMHIAAALGKKQIALHGPTNPKLWGPLNEKAVVVQSPCPQCPSLKLGFEYHRTDQACMSQLDVQSVKAAVKNLIDKNEEI